MKFRTAAATCVALLITVSVAQAASSTRSKRVGQTTNTTIALSGAPPLFVVAGNGYTFTPTLSNPSGTLVAYSVQNKPSWAVFSTATGTLSGTPATTQVGTYASILITASNGTNTASLPAFSINVTAPAPVLGNATLSWDPTTTSTTGEPLTDLAGYRVYAGKSADALALVTDIANAGAYTSVVPNLGSGTWYFAVTAYTSAGLESDRSPIGSTTIP